MADTYIKISELEETTLADDSSYIPIDNGNHTYKISVENYNSGANATAKSYAEAAAASADDAETAKTAAEAAETETGLIRTATQQYATAAAGSAADSAASAIEASTHAEGAATSESNAEAAAQDAADYATLASDKATLAESWAVGDTHTRTGEDTNNASYYAGQAQGAYENAIEQADAAGDSADAAASSASDAADSATAAAGSAGDASDYATAAAGSATAAATSATQSANSAGAAATSATNAAASATAASGSASTATTQANNAAQSATTAGGYATQAASSASDASGYATNSANSATASAASATAAAASETAAAGSATAAASSASDAADSAADAAESAATFTTDDTLSIAGKAADAKAAGDMIAAVQAEIPELDNWLTTPGAAAEAKHTGDRITEVEDDVADLKSAFDEFPSGSYPDMTVGGVMSVDGGTEDQVPYTLRASGGGVAVGNREIDEIVGGTVAWNQLYKTHNNYTGDTEFDESGLTATVVDGYVDVTGTSSAQAVASITVTPTLLVPIDHVYLMLCDGWNGFTWARSGFAKKAQSYHMTKHTANFTGVARIYFNPGETYNIHARFSGYDLTAMFGTAIADYIYALETAHAGDGVAWFKRLFPADYYAYDAGSLKSVEGVSAHVMRDADDNIIGNYPLDSSLTLRGILKLDAANRLYYDGDRYSSDGTVVRRYGIVDLGTLTWTKQANESVFRASELIGQIAEPSTYTDIPSVVCANYEVVSYLTLYSVQEDKTITALWSTSGSHGQIWIRDSAYTDAATFKTAMSGVYLVYELATPTTETADPYTNPQTVDADGTEEYVTTGIVPVGHYTIYPTDIVAKVDGLPSDFSTLIAPTETAYKATRAYSVNQFLIVQNQLYRVTASIASGATITPGTNVTACTVADILTQLLNA